MTDRHTMEAWVRRFNAAPDHSPRPRLVCFPHASGAASYYLKLSRLLAPEVEVLALQYPGRQDRRHEPLIDDLHVLADRACEAIAPFIDRPTAFFGHSMGAVVAYETALRLDRADAPEHLFVSGRRAPSVPGQDDTHRLSDDDLIAVVTALDGTDSRVLDDPELRPLILPTMRGDYRAIETYAPRPSRPLSCSLTVLVGDSDPLTTVDAASAWEAHTTGSSEVQIFPGGHFYLNDHWDDLAALAKTSLSAHA
ncbi:alpha/beta fold hydrolase [Nocardiopsis exhalans]|uniref:Alpha/beta fold hydrolase n=1 Tax=Nocardiopsis exhalans TaxID=163604 RepID=A0ABY5D303_9ACTN|nr:alpha/beta fold hydrolase [Nocardiopsis exhalans]USY18412.1 alpha/beta fold hydrolase [Nocardiopsis exhalans]